MDNRGVIWARVSSEEQKGGYSLDAQERLLKDFAKNKEINVVQTFKVAESASTAAKRKEFKTCLNFVEKEKVPFLIAEKVDRVTRNLFDLARIYELMKNGHLTVHFVREGMAVDDESDPSVHLTFNIIAAVAAYIARNIGREARKGMKEKAEQGGLPYKCPIGYRPAPDPTDPKGKKRTVEIDPERAPLVIWAFEQYATGKHSLATLAAELNRKGLTTRPNLTTPARPIMIPTLAKILANPFYHGVVMWSGGTYEGKHKPLVSKQLFDLVRVRLKEKTSYIKPAAKKWFPFKAFLRCGYCEKSITALEQEGGNVYYRCSSGRKVKEPDWYMKNFGQKNCIQPEYRQKDIDRMIKNELVKIAINETIAAKIRQHLKQTHSKQVEAERRELQRLTAEQTRKQNQIDLMYEHLCDGLITKDEYVKKKAATLSALANIQADLDRLKQTNLAYKKQGTKIIELMQEFKNVYEAANWKGKARILSVVLDKIELKGEETSFIWHEPFDTLFVLAPFINSSKKGE